MITNILEYLKNSVERYPSKIAFKDKDNMLTFQQTDDIAKQIGTYIGAKYSPNSPVIVVMDKTVFAVATFLGVVYAGCFYVPVDSSIPDLRIMSIIDTLNAQIIISDKKNIEKLHKLDFKGEIITYEDLINKPVNNEVLSAASRNSRDIHPLYTIFTSGSTGTPKGVVASHRSVISFIEEFTKSFNLSQSDIIGNQAPFDFDVSVKDIYSTLKTGATLFLIPKSAFLFPTNLMDYLCNNNITTIIWAVSALCILSSYDTFSYKVPHTLNKIMFSGEIMPIKQLNIWRNNLPQAMYVNLYGPTEITCNCTYYILDREFSDLEMLPIGDAFKNSEILLLNEKNQKPSQGEIGEICVKGTGLTLGYYNNDKATSKVFVQNPLNSAYQELIYRTGDLGKYNEQNQLFYVSRKDFQIKHNGHRIELSEIEIAVNSISEIISCCCVYNDKDKLIVLIYQGDTDDKSIILYLKNILPKYMWPNKLVKLEKMPTTKNGKINRSYLNNEYAGK